MPHKLIPFLIVHFAPESLYNLPGIITGEKFNIFNILKLESSEVRLHSAILTDLLNPEGSHGQQDLFLKLFVEQFGLTDFETKSAKAEAEYNSGPINLEYTRGGRIDILITDKTKKKYIIIENKIYADDQRNQLVRYHNFAPYAPLFYLNLTGEEPKDLSTDDKKLSKENYRVISYRYDIIPWLIQCRKETVSLHMIRETLTQYINILSKLANITTMSELKEEIKKLIVNNPDYIESIEKCSSVLQSIVAETNTKFKELFDKLYPKKQIYEENGITFHTLWAQDNADGVFIGYYLMNGDKNISGTEIGKEYAKILNEPSQKYYSNPNFIGWFIPQPFERKQLFIQYDKKEILKMDEDDHYLLLFVEGLVNQANQITDGFVNRLQAHKK